MNMKQIKLILISVFLISLFSACTENIKRKIGSCYLHEEGKIKYLSRTQTGEIDTIILNDANAVFFEIISDEMPGDECVNGSIWAKDKLNVWYKDRLIQGADPASFKLTENGYATDKNYAYYFDKLLVNIELNSFKVLTYFFAKDKNIVVYQGNEVFGIEDIHNFDIIDGYFSADGKYIYFNNDTLLLKIPDSDPKTFKCFAGNDDLQLSTLKYYTDKDKVYFVDTEKNVGDEDFLYVFDAFTESFEVLPYKYYSRDNFNIYYKNRIIENADMLTFNPEGKDYAKDKANIFFKNKKLKGADINTFRVFEDDENFDARDSENYYLKGKKVRIEN